MNVVSSGTSTEHPDRKALLTVEYEGTGYHGWQFQPGLPTVQGEVQAAVARVVGEPREVSGASRTDRGVHACGQAAAYVHAGPIPIERLPRVLNAYLPKDIRVRRAKEVALEFNPRQDAYGKIYRYTFLCRDVESVFLRRVTCCVGKTLDVPAMRLAASQLCGKHDFRSFQNASKDPPESTVRELFAVDVYEEGPLTHIQVAGSAFLYNMVRNISGTLLEVGLGRRKAERMKEILESRDRRAAGAKAEACGLCLLGVYFSREALERSHRCRDFLTPMSRL